MSIEIFIFDCNKSDLKIYYLSDKGIFKLRNEICRIELFFDFLVVRSNISVILFEIKGEREKIYELDIEKIELLFSYLTKFRRFKDFEIFPEIIISISN
jgi:hypothetical protein